MEKHLAVKLKGGATFMTVEEFKNTPRKDIIDWKVPELTVKKSTASTVYNRPCVALIKDDYQWGVERYYEMYYLRNEPGLLEELLAELEHAQKWGYEIKFEGFAEGDQ